MNDDQPGAPTPVAHVITEGVTVRPPRQQLPDAATYVITRLTQTLRRRGKHSRIMDEKILCRGPRFSNGIRPEMPNPALYKTVRAACRQHKKQPDAP
jgi:hypothetical protein